jgi:pimeloyl-ACP methyl ester carboxylesterase
VKLLLRHPFDSAGFAATIQIPALIVAAQNDRVIPPAHAERLANAWSGERQLRVLQGVGHNDVEQHPEYFALINQFLLAL